MAAARAHYNQEQYDEAIAAATVARRAPETADAAAIVLARAHLERYRNRADPVDLSTARDILNTIRADGLEARDQLEILIALGQSLFLSDDFGAAAAMFESGLGYANLVDVRLGDALLEWWGSAMERQGSGLPPSERRAHFSRVVERMRQLLAERPTSPAAIYWSVVALRGAGELQRAWDAAVAGWVRARLSGEGAAALRADLDRLVLGGILPDRVRQLGPDGRGAAELQMKADWAMVKERWR